MAFSRKQMVAAVAGTLSLAVLTGCPATPPAAVGTPTPAASGTASTAPSTAPSAAASGAASVAPSTAPSTAPSAGGSAAPGSTPTPTTSAPPPSGEKVIVSGNVYDEDGATVDNATITVKSLDASVPYSANATTNAGSWVVNNVPEGANVEIIATKDGWTSRRRVGSFQKLATGKRNVINFGAAGGASDNEDDDPTGEAYFISDFPEIVMTTPADDAKNSDATKLSYKVTFSEPLTKDSRTNFEAVFNILPASQESLSTVDNGGGGFVAPDDADIDLERGEDTDATDGANAAAFTLAGWNLTDGTYTLGENDTFLGSTSNRFKPTWNAEGTEVTFALEAGLLADDSEAAKYQAVLIVDDPNDEIEDEDSNQLGTNEDGDQDSFNVAGDLIFNAFKEGDLSADDTVTDVTGGVGENNWASTHDTVSTFELAEDEVDPKLTGLDVSDEDGDLRIAMTFSEPMAAYGGNAVGISSTEIDDLDNYIFAVAENTGDLTDDNLDDTPDTVAFDSGTAIETQITGGFEDEFNFVGSTQVIVRDDDAGLADDAVFIEVDEDDPHVVLFWLGGAKEDDTFNNADELAVRVENVEDPSGNPIDDDDADDQVQTANI